MFPRALMVSCCLLAGCEAAPVTEPDAVTVADADADADAVDGAAADADTEPGATPRGACGIVAERCGDHVIGISWDCAVSEPAASGGPYGFGLACSSHAECHSGWCLPGADGRACSQPCTDACPAGYDCHALTGGSDVVFLCVPTAAPCTEAAECTSGTCEHLPCGSYCRPPG